LPAGRYYEYDLIGMQVKTELGEPLGTLEEVWELPANHVFVVRRQGREILIPATTDVVVSVDLAGRTMTIRPIGGLVEYQDAV
jgi:16S rRNA processing protein RimM